MAAQYPLLPTSPVPLSGTIFMRDLSLPSSPTSTHPSSKELIHSSLFLTASAITHYRYCSKHRSAFSCLQTPSSNQSLHSSQKDFSQMPILRHSAASSPTMAGPLCLGSSPRSMAGLHHVSSLPSPDIRFHPPHSHILNLRPLNLLGRLSSQGLHTCYSLSSQSPPLSCTSSDLSPLMLASMAVLLGRRPWSSSPVFPCTQDFPRW